MLAWQGGSQEALQPEGGRVQLRYHALGDDHGQAALQRSHQRRVHDRGGGEGLPSYDRQELVSCAGQPAARLLGRQSA